MSYLLISLIFIIVMSYKTGEIGDFINSKMLSGEGHIGSYSIYAIITIVSLIPLVRFIAAGFVIYKFYIEK